MLKFIEPDGTPFDKIDAHNRYFIANFHSPTFIRSIQMDPTRNYAQCYIQAALEEIVKYPQGEFPMDIARPSIESTNELLQLCASEYPAEAIWPLRHAFNTNWNLWYGTKLMRCPPLIYPKRLFQTGDALQLAIRTFNVYVAIKEDTSSRKPPTPSKSKNCLKGPKTSFMEEQRFILRAWINEHPDVLRGCKTHQRAANLCWLEHKSEWDIAAKLTGDSRGYKSAKALAASLA